MPFLTRLHAVGRDAPADLSAAERFTRALVRLTRTVWHPDCTFETAVATICEVAAGALLVERVSVWSYDRSLRMLRCLHCWQQPGEGPADVLVESLSLQDDDYMEVLTDVRTLDDAEFKASPSEARSHIALRDYLDHHRIMSRLDAPAFVEGELHGLICHESKQRGRRWSAEELTFAASMGDYVGMAHEIARRRRAEADAQHQRLHDASSGLPNRDYLLELVRQRIESPRVPGEVLAIVHVRIDVSEGAALSGGAPTEDEVMAQIARRLRQLTNYGVELARVHSNGFAFALARNGEQGTAVRLAEDVLAAVRSMQWSHEAVQPVASAGIAFADVGESSDPRELLRKAEEAADRARLDEPFAYEVFDLAHHEALVERLRTEHALGDALTKGELEVHYQPEYDAGGHCWVGAEALLRWREGGRLLAASEFIGVAESSGLILGIGRWVLQRACRDATRWPALADGTLPTVRVNVSARQFDDAGLVRDVAAALADSGLAPGRLCLEITETTLMASVERAAMVLEQLKDSGVHLAIDDFGTGFASLVYLKRFPVDVLKIDRSFIMGLPGARVDAAIVAAVAGLATSLGIDVVAEGVETPEQELALRGIGVRRMQGWRFARAMDQLGVLQVLAVPPPRFAAADGNATLVS